MVALNEKFSHSGNLVSGGQLSPQVIEDFDFTRRSGEVHGGSVVNFRGAGCRGLSDASPSRRRSAAPLNQSDPETELYYVRNRTYSPTIGRWVQRDPIGYSGGINLYEYVGGRAVENLDPSGLWHWYNPFSWPIFEWGGSAAGHAVGGGEFTEAAGALPYFARFQLVRDARNRKKYGEHHCPPINPETDPLYLGLQKWSQDDTSSMTPAEHQAVQEMIARNAKMGWWKWIESWSK